MKGLRECLGDLLYVECYLQQLVNECRSVSLELICFVIFTICIIYLILRGQMKLRSKRSMILLLILVSCLCTFVIYSFIYFIYNINRSNSTLYFLQQLFQGLYMTYLIFYFGRKLTIADQLNRCFISILTYTLLLFNLSTFVYSLYLAQGISELCKIQAFTWFRTFDLITQIIFTLITRQLHKKVLETLKHTLSYDEDYVNQKKKLELLMFLVYLSLFGSAIQLGVNFIYLFNNNGGCRLIAHIGDQGVYNISDTLNSFVQILMKILTFFAPFILSLVIFKPQKKYVSEQQSLIEPEPLEKQDYFDGLSLHQIQN